MQTPLAKEDGFCDNYPYLLINRFRKDRNYKTPGRSFAKMLNVLCECSAYYAKEVTDE